MREELRFNGKIMSAIVSWEADKWFISITVEADFKRERIADGQIGIDLGIKAAIATSDGQMSDAPKPLKRYLKKLKRLNRAHSRKTKGSVNRKKSQRTLARLHARIKNIRKDWTHKITTKLCRENQTICLEDLKVKNMMKNHKLARAISDIGFYEIRRQIEYKSKLYGNEVVVINQWLPTSKTCSNCGCKKDVLALSERVFSCKECGFSLDRDLNAARNILAAGLAVSACGPESSGLDLVQTKLCRVESGIRTEDSDVLTT